jgi:DNA (cytosine-5)-methyltransferase 1
MRIVKEMRDESRRRGDKYIRPRYMVWENVPGALTSGEPKGEDFRIVLEEIARGADKDAVIPRPADGKWSPAGCIVGDGWSVAWRVHDAQFWGVPQRRKRIALVVDFGGMSAPEILFERKGVSGRSEPSREAREDPTGEIGDGSEGTEPITGSKESRSVKTSSDGKADALVATVYKEPPMVCANSSGRDIAAPLDGHYYLGCGSRGNVEREFVVQTAKGPGAVCAEGGINWDGTQTVPTLTSRNAGGAQRMPDKENFNAVITPAARVELAICYRGDSITSAINASNPQEGDPCHTLNCDSRNYLVTGAEQSYVYDARGNGDGATAPTITGDHQDRVTDYTAIAIEGNGSRPSHRGDGYAERDTSFTLNATEHHGVCTDIVRRLTPVECERLQNFPDGWTDIGEWTDSKGKLHKSSDAPRYKALGNSIALPFWHWLIKRISAQYSRTPTLGSLFDGIGGFPLCWTRVNGVGSAVWSSEIEEFCIAVTKKHFGDGETEGDIRKYL